MMDWKQPHWETVVSFKAGFCGIKTGPGGGFPDIDSAVIVKSMTAVVVGLNASNDEGIGRSIIVSASKEPNSISRSLPDMKSVALAMGSDWTVVLGVERCCVSGSLEDGDDLCVVSSSLSDWFRDDVMLLSFLFARRSAAGTRPDRPGGLYTQCKLRFVHR